MMAAQTDTMFQNPTPGTCLLRFAGDLQRFTLDLKAPESGTAWLRTNIGWAGIGRQEIVDAVERDKAILGRDWFDIPMVRTGAGRFEVGVPLGQVGHFEAKCYFQHSGSDTPLFPAGENVSINVEPAETCCSNTIYNAFVRQFGPNKERRRKPSGTESDEVRRLDEAGFAVIPPSGTFRDLIAELDFIIGTLGCRYIQLLPINPTPTTYARMGRFGSPYAALSFTAVDPALARFDPKATPLEQFTELVDAVHLRGGRLLLDLAVNHTGWAAALHESHPQWLRRDPAGRIENPGAWGVTWADLTELDYRHRDLWRYVAEVFLTWCRRGVDGFRCDAGYMIPQPAWTYIVARVREQYPDTVFFLEGLGGKIAVTRALLDRANFNWAYSELFQNEGRGAIEHYLPEALDISRRDGLTIHFAETHDNNRLAAASRRYARMRTALCALASICGGFAFANGVEWYATEKIDVHDSPSLNWGATHNQVDEIGRLTTLLHRHPAFYDRTRVEMVQEGEGNHLVLLRHHKPTGRRLLILVNLDAEAPSEARWDPSRTQMGADGLVDLLSGRAVSVVRDDRWHRVGLSPGQVLCLSETPSDLEAVESAAAAPRFPDRLREQRLRAKAIAVLEHRRGSGHLEAEQLTTAAAALFEDPAGFCTAADPDCAEPRVTHWQWPADCRRDVMVPPEFFLLVTATAPFRLRLMDEDRCLAAEDSLRQEDGGFFALIGPPPERSRNRWCTLNLSVYESAAIRHGRGRIRFLAPPENERVRAVFRRPDLLATERLFLGTNGLGGMLRAPVSWAALRSRYDALLAANLNPDAPDDRRVLLARCRVWSVFQGTSQPIGDDCLDAFTICGGSVGVWRFRPPTGQGQHMVLRLGVEMVPGKNAVRMLIFREPAGEDPRRLPDEKPVRLIIRPDIEDRSFHDVTKAYQGAETRFPRAVTPKEDGFDFQPSPDRALAMRASEGRFCWEPEWHYMVHRPLEAERGLDPDSDLFSPGYLQVRLTGGAHLEITAAAGKRPEAEAFASGALLSVTTGAFSAPAPLAPLTVFEQSLSAYVVRRKSLRTVIAGYPWFLDWGRDTLIFVRGLIAAGRHDDAARILAQFAAFEHRGTLPNMIRGNDAGDRDTSDAPLWFFTACADLIDAGPAADFLGTRVGGRSVKTILEDMARAMIAGTPSGIRVDPESGLLFSPAHFTWMDTNHPAGTPREGYPVEIQALWHAALAFLGRIDPDTGKSDWAARAALVKRSIADLYAGSAEIGLSDCLHGPAGTPARRAVPDDALRPNQLFAVTLGAVPDPALQKRILTACSGLLVPGAIRSLADRPMQHRLEIRRDGRLLVDPSHPYQGRYTGDEDTQRKPAYHNGTAWTWVFPAFCEAWAGAFPESGARTALAYLKSGVRLLSSGCIGHLPEILDGDAPHTPKGCDAQAWASSEYYRVWKKLSGA